MVGQRAWCVGDRCMIFCSTGNALSLLDVFLKAEDGTLPGVRL